MTRAGTETDSRTAPRAGEEGDGPKGTGTRLRCGSSGWRHRQTDRQTKGPPTVSSHEQTHLRSQQRPAGRPDGAGVTVSWRWAPRLTPGREHHGRAGGAGRRVRGSCALSQAEQKALARGVSGHACAHVCVHEQEHVHCPALSAEKHCHPSGNEHPNSLILVSKCLSPLQGTRAPRRRGGDKTR